MNTFHNFASCIYTTQGQILCQSVEKQVKTPMIVENFAQVNTNPNQTSGICKSLGKKLSDIVSNYNCTSIINSNPPNCSFEFKCTQ